MADKKTTPERPRRPGAGTGTGTRPTTPTTPSRPSARPTTTTTTPNRSTTNRGGTPPRRPQKRGGFWSWRNIRENFGWGLIIALPVILVVVAILFRATDGFNFSNKDANNQPLPTIAPSPTVGQAVPPRDPGAGAAKNQILYLVQSPDQTKPSSNIYSAGADGSNPVEVTSTQEQKSTPVWSPDGKRIAFYAANVGLQVINFDGTGLHTVAFNGFSPVWSPDSKQIAFLKLETAANGNQTNSTGQVRNLYITDADNSADATNPKEKALASDVLAPSFSPDGKSIAFFQPNNLAMFVIENRVGAEAVQVKIPLPGQTDTSKGLLPGWYPTFTADGKSLVFYGSPNAKVLLEGFDRSAILLTPTPVVTATTSAVTSTTSVSATTAVSGTTAAGATTTAAGGTTAAASGTTSATGTTATGTTVGATTAGATTAPISTTVGATPRPTTPPPTPIVSLYQVDRDGKNLKELTKLEDLSGQDLTTNFSRFAAYIGASSESTSLVGTQLPFRAGPVFSTDNKKVAALYANKDATGIIIVALDGSSQPVKIGQDAGLAPGIRINPTFTPDGNNVIYLFKGTAADAKFELKAYDLGGKTETAYIQGNSFGFPVCCGFKK